MNEKEVAELRRRFRPDKSAITHIQGCYVNENREIVSQFDQSLAMLSQEEGEKLLSILRRALSGTLGKNLIDLEFTTQQVVNGEEHRLLMALRSSGLKDEGAVQAFYQRAIAALDIEGNYMILLAHDSYDVPFCTRDGERQDDASDQVFSYILCAACPVKLTKPALSYYANENRFYNLSGDWVVSPPEVGFLFPAFDDRSANLYNALFYSRDVGENHQAFVDAVFAARAPMPAAQQKETFQSLLGDTLAEECSYQVVQAVQDQMLGLIQEHKENREVEPLVVSKGAVKQMLRACGVTEGHVEAFEVEFDGAFGGQTDLSPRNIVEAKLEVRTPDVTIQVNPQRSDLVQTRVINGCKYILIRADEGVEVNGVSIHIAQE